MRHFVTGTLVLACLAGCTSDDVSSATDGSVASDGGMHDASTASDAASSTAADAAPGDAAVADAGAHDGAVAATTATAALVAKSVAATQSTTTGVATFALAAGHVGLVLEVTGAPVGKHGVHIHAKGDCSAEDAVSAGGHWNPDMHMHGAPTDAAASELGDLGNITVGADGKGTLSLTNTEWTLGTGAVTDVVGKAVVVHAAEDDLTTQPNADAGVTPGNSGKRIACGVITVGAH